MDLQKKLAKTLKELRSQMNDTDVKMTQQEVADYVGINVKYYRELENGSRKVSKRSRRAEDLGDEEAVPLPTLGVIALLAKTFDLKLWEFCKLIEEQNE